MSAYLVQGKGWRYDASHLGTRITGAWYKTKEEALVAEGQRKEQIKNQSQTPTVTRTDMDLMTLCNARLDALMARSEEYYEENKAFLKKMLRLWGNRMCSAISRDMVDKWFTNRPFEVVKKEKKQKDDVSKTEKKRKPVVKDKKEETDRRAIANYELRMLRALFNFGIEKNWIAVNPTAKIKFYPRTTKQKRYVPPVDDIDKLLMATMIPRKRRNDEGRKREARKCFSDYVYIAVLIMTLARVVEVNRLEWTDIDFEKKFLKLYTRKKSDGNLTPRIIPLDDWVLGLLRTLYEQRDPSVSWVFPHTYWSRKAGGFVTGKFKDRKRLMEILCGRAKITYFRYHSLRHFGASMMAHMGVPLVDIQHLLGHEDLETTQIYIQSLVGSDRKAIVAFSRKLLEGFHTSPTQKMQEGVSPEANPLIFLEPMWGFEPQTC